DGRLLSLPLPIRIYLSLALGIPALVLLLMLHQHDQQEAAIQVADRTFLQTLTASQITTVQIGSHCILPRSRFASFVEAMHGVHDFHVNHDLGAYLGILEIGLSSGEAHSFRLYEQEGGTVLELYRSEDPGAGGQKGLGAYNIYGDLRSQSLVKIFETQLDACQ